MKVTEKVFSFATKYSTYCCSLTREPFKAAVLIYRNTSTKLVEFYVKLSKNIFLYLYIYILKLYFYFCLFATRILNLLSNLLGNAGNHQDRLECIEENRDNCSACPALTQAEQIQRRECKQCLMNCTAEQRGNSNVKFVQMSLNWYKSI